MVPALVAALVGAAVGSCRRPHGAHLARPRIVLPGLAIAGVGAHLLLGWFGTDLQGVVLAGSLALLTGFAVVNRHVVGMGVVAVGLAANLVSVVAHGDMPVRVDAVVDAGVVDAADLADYDPGAGRRFERDDDLVPILGDVIPVPPFRAAMSFGDLIVLVGIATVAGDLVRHARRGRRSPLGALRGLEPERGVELGLTREEGRLPEHLEDVEELAAVVDLVDPEDRLRDEGGGEGHGGQRAGVATPR